MAFLGKVDFPRLSETERVIYNYLSDNYEKIPQMHVRDVALEAHAGSSSVMRLIHKMGYDSYPSFQAFIESQQKKSMTGSDVFQLLSTDHYPSELVEKCRQLTDYILNSEVIVFLGLGASGSICRYAARRLATLGLNALAMTDSSYPLDSRLRNVSKSLVITLSISGETNEILEFLEHIRNNPKICLTSITPKEQSDLAEISSLSINYKVEERRINLYGDLTSQIPALFIIEILSEMIFDKTKQEIVLEQD